MDDIYSSVIGKKNNLSGPMVHQVYWLIYIESDENMSELRSLGLNVIRLYTQLRPVLKINYLIIFVINEINSYLIMRYI